MGEPSDGKPISSIRSVRSVEIPFTSPTPQQRHAGLQKHGSDPPIRGARHPAPDRPLQSQRSYDLPSRRSYEFPSKHSLELPSRRSWEQGALAAAAASLPSGSTELPSVQSMDSASHASDSPGQRQSGGHHRGRAAQQLHRGASLRYAFCCSSVLLHAPAPGIPVH